MGLFCEVVPQSVNKIHILRLRNKNNNINLITFILITLQLFNSYAQRNYKEINKKYMFL